jgi:hypothetical protein
MAGTLPTADHRPAADGVDARVEPRRGGHESGRARDRGMRILDLGVGTRYR